MNIEDHIGKADRVEKTMKEKLDVHADYETVIENCMIAGTHYLCAALHAMGVTDEDTDQWHTWKPAIENKPDDPELDLCLANLKYIEDIRPYYVRGWDTYTEDVGTSIMDAYEKVKSYCLKVVNKNK